MLSFFQRCSIIFLILFLFSSLISPSYSANGDYKIRVYTKGRIKELSLENYICGVIKGEVSAKWPIEALKTQAVLARTYTFNQMEKYKRKNYDIINSTSNQVYQRGTIDRQISKAVRETEREVVIYQGKLAKVFYHSSSGGHTANVADVWPGSDNLPYLRGVDDDDYSCGPKKYYPWFRSFKLETLCKKFSDLGKIKSLKISGRDSSGRVKKIVILGEKDERELTGNEFRYIMNFDLKQTDKNYFPSALFSLEIKNNLVIFKGKGSGHGVGLSQWGAKKMAEEGKSYEEILKYYFPGTEVGRVTIE